MITEIDDSDDTDEEYSRDFSWCCELYGISDELRKVILETEDDKILKIIVNRNIVKDIIVCDEEF